MYPSACDMCTRRFMINGWTCMIQTVFCPKYKCYLQSVQCILQVDFITLYVDKDTEFEKIKTKMAMSHGHWSSEVHRKVFLQYTVHCIILKLFI